MRLTSLTLRIFVVLGCLLSPLTAQDDRLEVARGLLLDGEPQAALELLDVLIRAAPKNAEALLARSSAHFMLGEPESGRRDLDKALRIEPELRQGWLNRAALDLVDGDPLSALTALEQARKLDPTAVDNHLNIGVALLQMGDLAAAGRSFEAYLAAAGHAGEAHLLVAINYAVAGHDDLAVEQLELAILADERTRLEGRTNPQFARLAEHPAYNELLITDRYTAPEGYRRARLRFAAAYDGGEGPLLTAVIESLRSLRVPFDPRVEVTPDWALIWSDARIKITGAGETPGELELSAPRDRFSPAAWQAFNAELFGAIEARLAP